MLLRLRTGKFLYFLIFTYLSPRRFLYLTFILPLVTTELPPELYTYFSFKPKSFAIRFTIKQHDRLFSFFACLLGVHFHHRCFPRHASIPRIAFASRAFDDFIDASRRLPMHFLPLASRFFLLSIRSSPSYVLRKNFIKASLSPAKNIISFFSPASHLLPMFLIRVELLDIDIHFASMLSLFIWACFWLVCHAISYRPWQGAATSGYLFHFDAASSRRRRRH